ncbi:hypothetical protein [Nitrosomonas sp.]|uniref:hypothetical protein n=1 Tax=Nitrosomonas sp. TaxID=42353 RepID=UPI0035AE7517
MVRDLTTQAIVKREWIDVLMLLFKGYLFSGLYPFCKNISTEPSMWNTAGGSGKGIQIADRGNMQGKTACSTANS